MESQKEHLIEKLNKIHEKIKKEFCHQINLDENNELKDILFYGDIPSYGLNTDDFISSSYIGAVCKNKEFRSLLFQKDTRVLRETNFYIHLSSSGSSHNFNQADPIKPLRKAVFSYLLLNQITGYYFAGTLKHGTECTKITQENVKLEGEVDILHTYDKVHRHSNMATHIFLDLGEETSPVVQHTHIDSQPIEAQKLSKPFMLLAGISGTGKTRFVREQAKLTNPNGRLEDTYCLVSVRPDWHEPSDLLGYTTRLSGKAEYVVTDVLHFIVQAWKELLRCGIRLEEGVVLGSQDQLTRVRPFWLCLDEMNLAPVEQYFADYLSILETREWEWSENEFTYRCDSLLKSTIFNDFFDEERFAVQNNLGLHDNEGLWEFFQQNGIAIPPNLVVVGTVNMDETTHGFSRKVLDRALTIDFGEFYPNDFDAFFHPQTKSKIFSFPHMSNSSMHRHFCSVDPDGKKSIQFLKTINAVLKDTTFELAFRALNELLLSVQSHTIEDEATLQAVWDDFLMSKVLPRIEGDLEKLAKAGSENTLLTSLQTVLAENLSVIWMDTARPDLHRETMDGGTILISCRSRQKLEWMSKRLDQFGFTTFWP